MPVRGPAPDGRLAGRLIDDSKVNLVEDHIDVHRVVGKDNVTGSRRQHRCQVLSLQEQRRGLSHDLVVNGDGTARDGVMRLGTRETR